MPAFTKWLFITLIVFCYITSSAQKLPNIQQTTLRAPANIKVDGKTTEWDNQFKAYNKATDIFYTIANDDDNIYLAIQATDADIIYKIINGRITFTINSSAKKNEADGISISYPIFDRKDRPSLSFREKPPIVPASTASLKKADSVMYANNKQMTDRARTIKVTGVKGLDTLISAYNDDGIKADALFNNRMAYTCEIAISLKLLGLSVNDASKFSYNVKLNALIIDDVPGINITRAANGEIKSIDIHKDQMTRGSQGMTAATDFWGEYTLAKK